MTNHYDTSVVIHRTVLQTANASTDTAEQPAVGFLSAEFWPFTVHQRDDDFILVFKAQSEQVLRLLEPESHTWLSGLENQRLILDMHAVTHISSPMAAWLCMISSYRIPMTLSCVCQRVMVQLNLLRLDRLFTIEATTYGD